MHRALVLGVPIVVALFLRVSDARACSGFPPCPWTADVLPRDGATEVPTNVWIRVTTQGGEYWPVAAGTGELVLRVAGGAAIEVDLEATAIWPVTVRALTLREALTPDTTYELVEMPVAGCSLDPTLLSTFTTGSGPDHTPPSAPVVPASGCAHDSCDESSCCGPYDGFVYSIVRTRGTDDTTGADDMREQLLGDGEVRLSSTRESRFLVGVPPNGRGGIPLPGRALAFRAVDLAGNLSDAVDSVLTCAPRPDGGALLPRDGGGPTSRDGGAPTSRDGGTPSAPGSEPGAPSGCSVMRGSTSPVAALAWVVGGCLLSLTRRKRATASGTRR